MVISTAERESPIHPKLRKHKQKCDITGYITLPSVLTEDRNSSVAVCVEIHNGVACIRIWRPIVFHDIETNKKCVALLLYSMTLSLQANITLLEPFTLHFF